MLTDREREIEEENVSRSQRTILKEFLYFFSLHATFYAIEDEIFVRSFYVGSFSSSMTRAETSSIEKAYITGARIRGTRRVSSGNTEALPVLWSRAKSRSTNERKQRRRGVCAVENSCSLSRTVYSRDEHVARGAESFFRPTTTFNERWTLKREQTSDGHWL